MTYDPKAKRAAPATDDDRPAPVDDLLGAVADPKAPPVARPVAAADALPSSSTTPDRDRLPEPVPTRRTPKAIAGALVALAIVLLGWRRYRR